MIVLCQVCFRGTDAVVRDSLNAGILVLLGVTAVVLGCLAYFFVGLARRARAAEHRLEEDAPMRAELGEVWPGGALRG